LTRLLLTRDLEHALFAREHPRSSGRLNEMVSVWGSMRRKMPAPGALTEPSPKATSVTKLSGQCLLPLARGTLRLWFAPVCTV
jgi:hypothetical protein